MLDESGIFWHGKGLAGGGPAPGRRLAAVVAARHAGVPVNTAAAALEKFRNVKRRLEVRGSVRGITVYDDFAHHPTAIAATLQALRARVGNRRILAVLELRSNTM